MQGWYRKALRWHLIMSYKSAGGGFRLSKSKSNAELRAENRVLRRFRTTEGVSGVVTTAIKWAAVVIIVRYAYLSVDCLAGKRTLANVGISVLGNVTVSQAIAWILGTGGVVYARSERRLRKNTTERLQGRIKAFEEKLDPKRSSSKILPSGDTRPEDK